MADLRGNLDLLQEFWSETSNLERTLCRDFDRLVDLLPKDHQVELRTAHIQTQLERLGQLKRECVGRIYTAASTKKTSFSGPDLSPVRAREAPAMLKEQPHEKSSEGKGSRDDASDTVNPVDAASGVDSTG